MSEGKRPGGLTVLAVLNFIFCGLSVLSLLGFAVFFVLKDMVPTEQMDDAQRTQIEALRNMGIGWIIFTMVLTVITIVLLILSGSGHLKQKRILGRLMGNLYAILTILSSVITALLFDPELGGGFNIGTMIGLLYPVITLYLINIVFRDDLVL